MSSKTDIIEALLFASDRPVPLKKLAQIVELSENDTREELDALREEKTHIGALQVLEVAGGWQVVTKPEFARHITKLRDEKRQKLSRAAFEVLAIVAYKQPATRADIEQLRGVDCAGSLQFLLEKKLLAFAGRKDAPGRPWLYATTPQFLDHFGLRSVEDMPSLSELAELNDDAAQAQTRNLFSRGAMAAQEETQPDGNARVLARGSHDSDIDASALQSDADEDALRVLAAGEAQTAGNDADAMQTGNVASPISAGEAAQETVATHAESDAINTSRVLAHERQDDAPKSDGNGIDNVGESRIADNAECADSQNDDALPAESDAENLALSTANHNSNDAAREQEGVA